MENIVYDIFIAYHGTYSERGSYSQAKKIADYLKEHGFAVYLHGYAYAAEYPSHRDTLWNDTWKRVNQSKTFLLVINDDVPKTVDGTLGNDEGEVSQIQAETSRFCSLVNSGKRNKHDFNWYYCGNIKGRSEQQKFLEQLYCPLTDGHNSLLLGNTRLPDVANWLAARLDRTVTQMSEKQTFAYDSPYSTDFFTVCEGDSFQDIYQKACFLCKTRRSNLLMTVHLDKSEFSKPFPFPQAIEKAHALMGNKPSESDEEPMNVELSLYHGDYIKFKQDGRWIDGYTYAIKELREKPTSRRSLISLISSQHIVDSGNKQIPSYLLSQFQIQNNVLLVTEYFRAMEISGFFPTNMAETYILANQIISALPDIKEVYLVYHIFDAYISDQPHSSLYIPLMDRMNAELDIIPAVNNHDIDLIVKLLEDKLVSKIYNLSSGFEVMFRCVRKYNGYGEQILTLLKTLCDECKTLEKKFEGSNDPQLAHMNTIEAHIKKLISLFREEKR